MLPNPDAMLEALCKEPSGCRDGFELLWDISMLEAIECECLLVQLAFANPTNKLRGGLVPDDLVVL
jgi:hypothetical protein